MNDETFDVALWGLDWDSIERNEHMLQGSVALMDGELILDIPFGTLFKRKEITQQLDEARCLPALYGFDLKGKYCALRNILPVTCEEHFPGGTHEVCKAQYYMISDSAFNPSGRIVKLRCRFSHLDQWAGSKLSALYSVTEEGQVAVSLKETPSDSITLLQAEWGSIDVVYSVTRRSLTSTSLEIGVGSHVDFTFNEPVYFDAAIRDFLVPFGAFLSFCMGTRASIEKLSSIPYGTAKCVRIAAPFPSPSKGNVFSPEMPIVLSWLSKASVPLTENWLGSDDELKAACNLAASLLVCDSGKEIASFFLESAQLLEMMAKYKHEKKRFSDEELKRRIDLVRSSVSRLDREVRDWVHNRLNEANGYGQHRLLTDLLKSLGEFAEWLIPNKKSFLSMHVEMRNSLTHRDSAGTARYDPRMLAAHSQGVLVLSYGAILIRLGLSDDEVIDIVKHSRFARIARKFRGLYPSN